MENFEENVQFWSNYPPVCDESVVFEALKLPVDELRDPVTRCL